jgi:hypothetical protein
MWLKMKHSVVQFIIESLCFIYVRSIEVPALKQGQVLSVQEETHGDLDFLILGLL